MANELPEVVPDVQSMPTTGWFCQTQGSARRRITANSSKLRRGKLDIEGVYDVAGIPGHTHNASAVISADANYSAYRKRALRVAAGIWGHNALNMPVGLLTDSVEPDNASERYERAIERCVGNIALFPENCTGHIREPTRSISEIRTLVAPKSRLDTLTYTEERGGWRAPKDENDYKEQSSREELVSAFPDVYVDVRPLTQVKNSLVDRNISPSSLYLETDTYRYIIRSAEDGLGTIGTLVDGTPWDGTLRFVWDDDARAYRTKAAVSVTLNDVREVTKAADAAEQAPVYDIALDAVPGAGHAHRITVTFPLLQTSQAFDGNCWIGNMRNEEALNYASLKSGLSLNPRYNVEVTGVQANIGPFYWVGMPAYRIPIGGTYGHPCSDILLEQVNDGTVEDAGNNETHLQYNHWDKLDAFVQKATDADAPMDGFLRYQFRQTEAEQLYTAAQAANAIAGTPASQRVEDRLARARGLPTFNIAGRISNQNSGIFYARSGGILGQLTAAHYPTHPTFEDYHRQYRIVFNANNLPIGAGGVSTTGIRRSLRYKDAAASAATAAVAAAPIVYGADGTTVAPTSTFDNTSIDGDAFSLRGTTSFSYANLAIFGNAGANLSALCSDKMCVVPGTPLMYQLDGAGDVATVGDFSGDELFIGDIINAARVHVPRIICNCSRVDTNVLELRYNLENALVDMRGYRLPDINIAQGINHDAKFFLRGWSFWLHQQDNQGTTPTCSNFTGGASPDAQQVMRNAFRDIFATGNKFPLYGGAQLADRQWYPFQEAVTGNARIAVWDYVFALEDDEIGGVYFETTLAPAATGNRKLCWFAPASSRQGSYIFYETANDQVGEDFVAGRVLTEFTAIYRWDQATNAVVRATYAELNIAEIRVQALNMYVLGPDWYRAHIGNDPYGAVRADSNRLGPVFQSIKRISQHVCAPVINPNLRIGAKAPLNHDSRHLPPEIRDFRLQLSDIDWGRLQTDRVTLNELTMYDFKGGVQKVGAEQNVMYLPEFREYKATVTDNTFEYTLFSELGSPSYFAIFCRSAVTDILQQPLIKTLSIFNATTKKKSNAVQEMSIGQLYHLTQRNVHPNAEYDRASYRRRQTVLLSAEDVGLMGLQSFEYQKAKRVQYTFSGTTDRAGQLYIVLVYNNRGLHIDGRRLQVVTLHE